MRKTDIQKTTDTPDPRKSAGERGVRPTIAIDQGNDNIKNCFQKAAELADLHGMFVGEKEALELVKRDTLLIVVDVNNFSYTEFPSVFTGRNSFPSTIMRS